MHRPNSSPRIRAWESTESHDSCSYLDLNIKVLNGNFCTDLYDRRDLFSFSVVIFSHMDSNASLKTSIRSSNFTVSLIFCNHQDFVYRSKLLTARLLRQGYVYQKLCSTYKNFVAPIKTLCIVIPEVQEMPEEYHYQVNWLTFCLTQLDTCSYHTYLGILMHTQPLNTLFASHLLCILSF